METRWFLAGFSLTYLISMSNVGGIRAGTLVFVVRIAVDCYVKHRYHSVRRMGKIRNYRRLSRLFEYPSYLYLEFAGVAV